MKKKFLFCCLLLGMWLNVQASGESISDPVIVNFGSTYNATWEHNTTIYNKVTIPDTGILKMEFKKPYDYYGDYGRLKIVILDLNGKYLWSTNSTDEKTSVFDKYTYYVGLKKGTYLVNVTPGFSIFKSTYTNYTFAFNKTKYTEVESNDFYETASTLSIDKFYQGYYGRDFGDYGKFDTYKIYLSKGITYKLVLEGYNELKGAGAYLYMTAPDSNRKNIIWDFDKINANGKKYYEFIAPMDGIYYFQLTNYMGKQLPYRIGLYKTKKTIKGSTVITGANKYAYTGSSISPTVVVTKDGVRLKKDKDYTVSYKNNLNVGTATIIVTGIGNYTGTISKTYQIVPKSITKSKIILGSSSYNYTGTSVNPTIVVKDGTRKLQKDVDYTVKYSNNKAVGNGVVTIIGKGNYGGTFSKTYPIVLKQVQNLTLISKAPKSLTLTWNKVSGARGYEIYMSTSKNGLYKKVGTSNTNSFLKTNLSSNTIYYFKVRAYTVVDGKLKFSKFSNLKARKI